MIHETVGCAELGITGVYDRMCGGEDKTKSVGLQRFDDTQDTHLVSSTSPSKRYTKSVT